MSSEHKSDSINIYLRNEEQKSDILSNLTSERKYIILQNDTLQSENKELVKKIKELEFQIEELETDSGKNETSIRYIKGMLKNFVEIDKIHKKIDVEQRDLKISNLKNQKITSDNRLFFIFAIIIYKILSSLLFVFCLAFDLKILYFMLDKWLFAFILYKSIKKYKIEKVEYSSLKIEDLNRKIEEIRKAQDYINDLIDNC